MGKRSDKSAPVDLVAAVSVLHEYLTPALCSAVYEGRRKTERKRIWTLGLLVEFWTAVVLRAPESLTQALEEAALQRDPFWPPVEASPQAFFSRCKDLRWEFFRDVYEAFVAKVLQAEPPAYARDLAPLEARFSGIWVVDGSMLDAVAHRLKVTWKVRPTLMPGGLVAVYDVLRGIARRVVFQPDAASSEVPRAVEALEGAPSGTLVLADALFCTTKFFDGLSAQGLFGVVRRNKSLQLRRISRLFERRDPEGVITDDLVEAGCGQHVPRQTLRLIKLKRGNTARTVLTNVLDPAQLSAEEALGLYRRRWGVERLFYDLKEVLNLHRFYAANTNAVAMQVYATALVHVAMRVAQARIARAARIPPETISPKRLFPRIAAMSYQLAQLQMGVEAVVDANPGVSLKRPQWERILKQPHLASILVRKRKDSTRRKPPGPCRAWKSLGRVVRPPD
jgi:hypothetical protein